MRNFAPDHFSDPRLRINLFGPLSAETAAGHNALPRGRKAQAILCYLAMADDDRVPRQRLVELLWSTRWTDQGRASLRQALIDLKASLAPVSDILEIDRNEVGFVRSRVWVDYLSVRSDSPGAPVPRQVPRISLFLETLQGLDPGFDAWIAETRAALDNASAAPLPVSTGQQAEPALPGPTVRRRLLISVAPVIQMGSVPVDEFVAPALALELVNAIARFRWLSVRFSPEAGCADYRVEGYLTSAGKGARVVLRLVDEREGDIVVWTGESQSPLPLSPDSISSLVESLIVQLDPEILAIETRKAFEGTATSHDAYACVLRGMALLYRFEEEAWREALKQLSLAHCLDPHYARAFAVSALCRITGIAQGWVDEPVAALALADTEARRAIGLDPRDSLALALAGHIRAFVHHDFVAAVSHFDRATAANPSCGFAWAYSALTYAYLCRTDEARLRLDRATAILLHDPFLSFLEGFQSVISYFAGDYEAAIAIERDQLLVRPRFTNSRKILIASLCRLERIAEARSEQAFLDADEPSFRWTDHLQTYPFARARDRDDLRAALVAAGLVAGSRVSASLPFTSATTSERQLAQR